MKDKEVFTQRCENCVSYPCVSLTNLDKLYGSEVYIWAKHITQQVGCKAFPNGKPTME